MMRRVNVIGNSCAGKSTFAARLAAALDVPHVELDSLYWEPGWVPAPLETFRARVSDATAGDGWIADGNYQPARDLIWPRVDTIVWLDYSFKLVLWRAVRRSLHRVFRGDLCCNGNRESLRLLLSRESIIIWVVRMHALRRRQFRSLLPAMAAQQTRVVVLPTPARAEIWLREVESGEFHVKPRTRGQPGDQRR
jgi:hypothetical protein